MMVVDAAFSKADISTVMVTSYSLSLLIDVAQSLNPFPDFQLGIKWWAVFRNVKRRFQTLTDV